MIAPSRPPRTTVESTTLRSIRPLPTSRDGGAKTTPRRSFQNAAPHHRGARRQHARVHDRGDGVRRVVKAVMKSKVRATSRIARTNQTGPASGVLDRDGLDQLGVFRLVERALQSS